MTKGFSIRAVALASSFLLSAGLAARAEAQAAAGASVWQERKTFNVAAQPLSQAVLSFSDQAGVQLVFGSPVTAGVNAHSVQGAYTISDALNLLLDGTGLGWRYLGNRTITIEQGASASVTADGARVLGAVQVEGSQATGSDGSGSFADLNGFGSGAGANGSSDVTATEGTGSLTTNGASVASRPARSLRETPQSVSVVTSMQLQEQHLDNVDQVMNALPGVTVTPSSGYTSSFISRGFSVSTFSIDGGGPLGFVANSATDDLSEYDHVELLRGSASLYGGIGDPSGTINLQRKRPLDHQQFILQGDLGSWNDRRIEGDVTSPLAFDGHLRARVDAVYQDEDFFYDIANERRFKIYGTLEADLGSNTTLRVGGSYQWQKDDGYNVDGLPRFPDGGDAHLPRSTNLAAPWNSGLTKTTEAFLVLEHKFNDKWSFVLNATRYAVDGTMLSNVAGGVIQPPDDTIGTNTGGIYSKNKIAQLSVDAHVSGSFTLFGREQHIIVGGDMNHQSGDSDQFVVSGDTVTRVPIRDFDRSLLGPKIVPTVANSVTSEFSSSLENEYNLYGNLDLNPLKRLHVSGGIRLSVYRDKSNSTEVQNFAAEDPALADIFPLQTFTSASKLDANWVPNPSASISYDIFKSTSIYASYNRIFTPVSDEFTSNRQLLPPVTGATYQAGIKTAPKGGKINASLSVFYTNENNVAIPTSPTIIDSCCYAAAGATKSTGVDLEVSGEIRPRWQIQAGYTYDHVHYNQAYLDFQNGRGPAGTIAATLTQQPKHQVKIFTTYQLAGALKGLKVGGSFRLDSARYTQGTVCSLAVDPSQGLCLGGVLYKFAFTQKLYTVEDLLLSYDIGSHWEVSLNVTNIADKRYYAVAGASAGGNFYGEPRKFLASLRMKY